MPHRTLPLLLALALAACAARTLPGRSEAPAQFWRPSAAKEAWRIGGHMETRRERRGLATRPRHEVAITVNGTEALRGEVPRDRPVELAGRAEGASLAALCTPRMVARAAVEVTCLVLVDNERAAALTFTAGTRGPA